MSDSLDAPSVRNYLNVVGQVSKEEYYFLSVCKKTRLLRMCKIRFIERQDPVNTFLELFPAIVISLEEGSQTKREISSTSSNLFAGVEKSF